MRALLCLLVLASSLDLAAQGVVPDTTDPATYYPLAVGNQWEYEPLGPVTTPYATHFRRTIVADTLIDGDRWFVQRFQGFRAPYYGWERIFDTRAVIRFDPDSANVLRWSDQGVEPWLPCRLDGPLGMSECKPGSLGVSQRKEVSTVTIGADEISTIILHFDDALDGLGLAASCRTWRVETLLPG